MNKISNVMNHNLKYKTNENTRAQYQRACDKFTQYVKETYGKERIKPDLYHETVQKYIYHLQDKGLSAHTVHTYVSGVVQGLNLSYKDFDHAKRERPQKGRERDFEIKDNKSAVGRDIGIRRSEYGRLKGAHMVEHDGRLFVVVDKGKGGKHQEQMILPKHEQAVRDFFSGKDRNEFILSKEDLKSLTHANEHAARREVAREAYFYYKELPRAEKDKLLEICHERFRHKYDRKYPDNPEKALKKGEALWRKEMDLIKRSPVRECRGANKAFLESQGRPTGFDRESVLLTSVLNLAHYREDVTVNNYLI